MFQSFHVVVTSPTDENWPSFPQGRIYYLKAKYEKQMLGLIEAKQKSQKIGITETSAI